MADSTTGPLGPNPSGLCMCGCGRATRIAMHSNKKRCAVKGLPLRYLQGHAGHRTYKDRMCVPGETSYRVDGDTGCWIWRGATDARGYARYSGRHAHTVLWEKITGKLLPPGMALHHVCENKLCVNPDHLVLIQQKYHGRHHAATYGGGKLTWEKVSLIRWFAERGMRRRHLATMYQVDKATIGEVIRRETWS